MDVPNDLWTCLHGLMSGAGWSLARDPVRGLAGRIFTATGAFLLRRLFRTDRGIFRVADGMTGFVAG